MYIIMYYDYPSRTKDILLTLAKKIIQLAHGVFERFDASLFPAFETHGKSVSAHEQQRQRRGEQQEAPPLLGAADEIENYLKPEYLSLIHI